MTSSDKYCHKDSRLLADYTVWVTGQQFLKVQGINVLSSSGQSAPRRAATRRDGIYYAGEANEARWWWWPALGGAMDLPGMLGVKAELLIILRNVETHAPNDTESHPTCCNCSNTTGCSLKSHIILSQQWRNPCSSCDAVQLGRRVLLFQCEGRSEFSIPVVKEAGSSASTQCHTPEHQSQYSLLEKLKSQT